MLDDSTNKFAIILRNEDLQNYAGDAFYNLVKAVIRFCKSIKVLIIKL